MWAKARAPPPASTSPSERPARRSASARRPVARSPSTHGQLPGVGDGDPGRPLRSGSAPAEEHDVRAAVRAPGSGAAVGTGCVGTRDEDDGVRLPQAEVAPRRRPGRSARLGDEQHPVVVALGAGQAVGVDDARRRDAEVLGAGGRPAGPRPPRPPAARVRARRRRRPRALRRARRPTARRPAVRSRSATWREHDAGGGRVGGERRPRRRRAGSRARWCHGGRARSPTAARRSAGPARRAPRPGPSSRTTVPPTIDLQPARAHDVGRAGRVARRASARPGRHRRPRAAACSRRCRRLGGSAANIGSVGQVGRGRAAAPATRDGATPRARRGGWTTGGRSLDDRPRPRSRCSRPRGSGEHGDDEERDDREHPAVAEGRDGAWPGWGRRGRRPAARCRAHRRAGGRWTRRRMPWRSDRPGPRRARRCRAAGRVAPTPMPLSTWPGIHSAQNAGSSPTCWWYQR